MTFTQATVFAAKDSSVDVVTNAVRDTLVIPTVSVAVATNTDPYR